MKRVAIIWTALTCAAAFVPAAPAVASVNSTGFRTISGGEVDPAQLAWQQVTGTQAGPTELIGMVRAPDGSLRVSWPNDRALPQSVVAPDGNVAIIPDPPIVQGWDILSSPALVRAPGGALRAFFGGRRSGDIHDPNRDLNVATSTDGGHTWALQPGPVTAEPNGSDYAYEAPMSAVAVGPDLHPLEAWSGSGAIYVHAGLTPSSPSFQYPQAGANQAAATPRLATGPNGAVELAWVSARPPAVNVQRVNPDTGAPLGQPVAFPGLVSSTGVNGMFGRTPLVGRSVIGGFFSAYRGSGLASDSVRMWGVGRPRSSEFAPHRRGVSPSTVALDGDARGHLWLAYANEDNGAWRVSAERSDARGRLALFGARVVGALPLGTSRVLDLQVSSQPDRLDVLATVLSRGAYATYSTQIEPGLTLGTHLSAAPAGPVRTVTFRVTDAGAPVAGAQVAFLGRTLRTGRKGTVALRTSSQRTATATASHAGYADAVRRTRL